MKAVGKLSLDKDGQFTLNMRISERNPLLYDVPLEELLGDFVGQKIRLEVFPVKSPSEVEKA